MVGGSEQVKLNRENRFSALPPLTVRTLAACSRASWSRVKCTANHLELHVRGVTAEPWGHGRMLLQRD